MAVKRITKLPGANGVGAGQTATFDLPIGARYHLLWIRVKDTASDVYTSIISDIRIKVNGKTQREFTPAQLQALNILMGAEYGVSAKDADGWTMIPIFFAEPWRRDPKVADGMAWGTGNLATFQLEIDILATAAGVALEGYAEVDNSITKDKEGKTIQSPMGLISKWTRMNKNMNGTKVDIQDFERREYYQQISIFDDTLTYTEITVEGYMVRKLTKAVNDQILTARGMTPVSTRFDIVFDYDDPVQNGLAMVLPDGTPVRDFNVYLESSANTNKSLTTIVQRIGPPD
jgi:hypothetical protein